MTSRLVIGTPRIPTKPPRRTPCTEPLLFDSNILRDPGFENHISATGGGPSGVEIPGGTVSGFTCPNMVLWSDSSCAPASTGWQSNDSGAASAGKWFISTANPRTGTYHARHNLNGSSGDLLRAYGFPDCRKLADRGTAGRVEAGTLVDFSFWAMVSASGGSPTVELRIWFFDFDSYSDLDFPEESGPQSLTTSYAEYSFSAVAPSWAYYMWAEIEPVAGGSTAFLDVDDATLEVA